MQARTGGGSPAIIIGIGTALGLSMGLAITGIRSSGFPLAADPFARRLPANIYTIGQFVMPEDVSYPVILLDTAEVTAQGLMRINGQLWVADGHGYWYVPRSLDQKFASIQDDRGRRYGPKDLGGVFAKPATTFGDIPIGQHRGWMFFEAPSADAKEFVLYLRGFRPTNFRLVAQISPPR